MTRGVVISILIAAVLLGAVLFGLAGYVSNLDQEIRPVGELERRGRAKYLIDSRWPSLNLKGLFSVEDNQ